VGHGKTCFSRGSGPSAEEVDGVRGPLAGAGRPDRRSESISPARRVGSWLVWWVILMALWVWADDSLLLSELIAGALIAAAAATVAEVVQHQAGSRIRIRIEWLARALRLPGQVLSDTGIVLGALWRKLARGEDPPSGFVLKPARYGDDSAEGRTRRALLLGGTSVSPNSYALGFDRRRDAIIVHHLVIPDAGGGRRRRHGGPAAGGGGAPSTSPGRNP
jgi:multisubunit Na+/H+ antiporter MnhE subunit